MQDRPFSENVILTDPCYGIVLAGGYWFLILILILIFIAPVQSDIKLDRD
jgi:hypothetical protein